jgi:hypothetical protein
MNRKRGIGGGYGDITPMAIAGNPGGGTANAAGVNIIAGPQFASGLGEIAQGRLSLIMLDSLIVLSIVFYLWTHKAQGGG